MESRKIKQAFKTVKQLSNPKSREILCFLDGKRCNIKEIQEGMALQYHSHASNEVGYLRKIGVIKQVAGKRGMEIVVALDYDRLEQIMNAVSKI